MGELQPWSQWFPEETSVPVTPFPVLVGQDILALFEKVVWTAIPCSMYCSSRCLLCTAGVPTIRIRCTVGQSWRRLHVRIPQNPSDTFADVRRILDRTSGHVRCLCRRPFVAAFIAFAIAQIAKCFTYYYTENKWDMTRIIGSGGMPSSHTSMVRRL